MNNALQPFTFIGHASRINVTVENKGHSGNEASSPPAVTMVLIMRTSTVHQEATSLFFVQPTLSSRSWFV